MGRCDEELHVRPFFRLGLYGAACDDVPVFPFVLPLEGFAMIGVIASSIIAFWYFKTADQLKLPIFQWVLGGMLVYYAGFAASMYLVLRPLLKVSAGTHSFAMGLTMDVVSAAVGIALAALFRSRVMCRKGAVEGEDGV